MAGNYATKPTQDIDLDIIIIKDTNKPLVLDEPVEFEKSPVEVYQGIGKITHCSRGISYGIYPVL